MKTIESIKDNGLGKESVMTIDLFNKLTNQETLHPLVTIANMGNNTLKGNVNMPCDFYALLLSKGADDEKDALRLVCPGEMFKMPSVDHDKGMSYKGVLFHPNLLCETPLDDIMDSYARRCCCRRALSKHDKEIIETCIDGIGKELHHSIDCHSATIIASQIELLLNYCTRFCSIRK